MQTQDENFKYRRIFWGFYREIEKLMSYELTGSYTLLTEAGASKCNELDIYYDIWKPLFSSTILALANGSSQQYLEKLLLDLFEYYGIDENNCKIKHLVSTILKKQTKLMELCRKAKVEQNENPEPSRYQRELSAKLDEYLRIGEEIEKAKEKTT